MARRKLLETERERDIAIEEAALAYYELNQLRLELTTLRQEKQQWEADRDMGLQRYDQILWHVGAMAESLWHAFQHRKEILSVEEAKLLALESFVQLEQKNDVQLYEEMHELYAKIAYMEAQQTKMSDKLLDLKRMNEDLVDKILAYEDIVQRGTQESTPSSVRDPVSVDDSTQTNKAAIHPLPKEDALASSPIDLPAPSKTTPSDSHVIDLLQAQLAMYVSYTKRHRSAIPITDPVPNRLDR